MRLLVTRHMTAAAEAAIRQAFDAGAARVSVDFTEGRLANKNDSRKKSRQRRARQFFVRDPLANLDKEYRKQNASCFFQKCLELDKQSTDDKLLVFTK